MSKSTHSYQGIKVTVITGFLGAGKTTVIKHLLSQVPEGQTWAVLINEFGDVGIDASFIENNQDTQGKHIQIKQVPGGCLCCTTSAAFGAGLNELIKRANPDHIIIEPTGIGHPDQIIKQLSAPHYHGVLELTASLCLLDARNLSNPRYLGHPAFFDQIDMADVLIATKQDTYDEFDESRFVEFAKQFEPAKSVIAFSTNGMINRDWLDAPRIHIKEPKPEHSHNHDHTYEHTRSSESLTSQPLNGVTFFEKRDHELNSLGWLIKESFVFDERTLYELIEKIQEQTGFWRAKGVFNTESGAIQVNITSTEMRIMSEDVHNDSRFECLFDASVDTKNIQKIVHDVIF